MKHNISLYGIVIIYAVMFSACSDDLKNELGFGHEIAFEIEPSSTVTTRSATEDEEIEPQRCITETADTFYLHTYVTNINDSLLQPKATTRGAQKDVSNLQSDGFKVSAYNTSDGTTKGSAYFEFLTATYAASKFTPQSAGNKKYWPAGKLMFYAYYPAATVSNGITQGSDATTLTYAVPSTPANHPDLMTAKLDNQQYSSGDGTSSLTFNHALCAIKFQTGTDIAGGTINSITFSNIKTSGTYNLDTNTWTDTSAGNVSFTGLDVATTEGTANTAIISGDNTLMMIPQSFDNNNQTITISLTDANSVQHTLNYILNGTSWTQGQCITYTITTNGLLWDYVLEAIGGYTESIGGNVSYTVKSYRKLKTSDTKEPIAWTVEGYSDDGGATWTNTPPSWLTMSGGTTGTGNTGAGEVKSTSVAATSKLASANAALQAGIQYGNSIETEKCFDLSMHNTVGDTISARNTANCYLVHAPGYYKIPLVYGNAITNGIINSSAYNSASFVDYKGTRISNLTAPYLKHSATPTSAYIIWQDAQNIIRDTNISIDNSTDDFGYLKFYIAPADIKNGNVVIAVRDGSGVIMWNWHIWITAACLYNETDIACTSSGTTYYAIPLVLGWIDGNNENGTTLQAYAARNVKIRLKQTGIVNNIRADVTINQHSSNYNMSTTGYCPVYQWGRKDPMPPSNIGSATDHTIYNGSGSTVTLGTATGNRTISFVIQNPLTFFIGSSQHWANAAYNDLWCVGNTTTSTAQSNVYYMTNNVKSIYDPSPAGYKCAPSNFFKGLTFSKSVTSGSYYNTGSGKTLFLPWTGFRDYSSSNWSYMNFHLYNTATPATDGQGVHVTSNTSVNIYASNGKAQGFANRCIRE